MGYTQKAGHAWTGLAMALAEKPLDYAEKTPSKTEAEYHRPNGLH